jgi:hypothetical protein
MLKSQCSFRFGLLLTKGLDFCPFIDHGITLALYQKIEIFLFKQKGLSNTLFQFQPHLILSLLRMGAYTPRSRRHEKTTNRTLDRSTRKESIEFIERTISFIQKNYKFYKTNRKRPFTARISNQKCPSKGHRGASLGP